MSEPIKVPDYMRRAMEAQGKIDPDEVAKRAAELDSEMHDEDEWEPLPIDPEQEAFALDEQEEDRDYGWEP